MRVHNEKIKKNKLVNILATPFQIQGEFAALLEMSQDT